MQPKILKSRAAEITRRVSLCSTAAEGRIIEMGAHAYPVPKQQFTPNQDTAYIEFYHSHAFPVTTIGAPDGSGGGTGLHPQVIANSYESLFGKVFNFNHVMHAYDPEENPRDLILGTIMSVEFPPTPAGGWQVQASRAAAPGIRGVAAIHKAAEYVPEILLRWFNGGHNPRSDTWTVSRELNYPKETSGFLLRGAGLAAAIQPDWKTATPEDLAALGYVYVPFLQAPLELLRCFDVETCDVVANFRGLETRVLLGGLTGTVRYYGTGLTPMGKEPEAKVAQMLASGISFSDPDDLMDAQRLAGGVLRPLHRALQMARALAK